MENILVAMAGLALVGFGFFAIVVGVGGGAILVMWVCQKLGIR